MSVIFRTRDEPEDVRVDRWEQLIAEALLPLRGRHRVSDFTATLVSGEIGPVRVAELSTPAGECVRSPRLIGEVHQGLYQIDVMARGLSVVEQDGNEATLGPGDFTLIDPARPARFASTATTHVSVLFPRALLPVRVRDAAAMTAVRISGDRGAAALVSGLARELPHHLDECDPSEAARLGGAVVDLLGAALAVRLDRVGGLMPQARRRVVLQHVYAYIDARLADPGLSPAEVAAAHHMSVRQLHKLFETQNTTVAAWIRRRRLERCRQDLLDPAQLNLPVAAVARRWAMPNAAHFNRVFRAAYGTTPAAYRAAGREG